MNESVLEAALAYHDANLPITICAGDDGKHPGAIVGKGWQRKRFTTDDIQRIFQEHPYANVGVILGNVSGIIDIECDAPESESDLAALFEGVEVPVTPTFKSLRGKHRLFAWCPQMDAIGKGDFHWKSLEVRLGGKGKGAQSLLPPSTTDGFTRQWQVSFDECNLAPLPALVIERLTAGKTHATQRNIENADNTGHVLRSLCSTTFSMLHDQFLHLEPEEAAEIAINACIPDGPRKRHDILFQLARWLQAIPAYADASPADVRFAVREWHRRANHLYRANWEDVWGDFIEGWDKVKVPMGQGVLDIAVKRAAESTDIPEVCTANEYSDPKMIMLVKVCRELASMADDNTFYLSSHKIAPMIGFDRHETVWRWMSKVLCTDRVLRLVKRGDAKKREANTYEYLPARERVSDDREGDDDSR